MLMLMRACIKSVMQICKCFLYYPTWRTTTWNSESWFVWSSLFFFFSFYHAFYTWDILWYIYIYIYIYRDIEREREREREGKIDRYSNREKVILIFLARHRTVVLQDCKCVFRYIERVDIYCVDEYLKLCACSYICMCMYIFLPIRVLSLGHCPSSCMFTYTNTIIAHKHNSQIRKYIFVNYRQNGTSIKVMWSLALISSRILPFFKLRAS